MRIAFFFFLSCLALFLSSCYIRTRHTVFKTTVPIASRHPDFNNDSLRCVFLMDANPRILVIPFLVFKSDKKKFRITYQLHGKGISGREYTCSFKYLVLKSDSHIVAKSKDPELFKEEKNGPFAPDGISPFYSCGYLVDLMDPSKMNLYLELEMNVHSKNNLDEEMLFRVPLKKTKEKSFKLLNLTK